MKLAYVLSRERKQRKALKFEQTVSVPSSNLQPYEYIECGREDWLVSCAAC